MRADEQKGKEYEKRRHDKRLHQCCPQDHIAPLKEGDPLFSQGFEEGGEGGCPEEVKEIGVIIGGRSDLNAYLL